MILVLHYVALWQIFGIVEDLPQAMIAVGSIIVATAVLTVVLQHVEEG